MKHTVTCSPMMYCDLKIPLSTTNETIALQIVTHEQEATLRVS